MLRVTVLFLHTLVVHTHIGEKVLGNRALPKPTFPVAPSTSVFLPSVGAASRARPKIAARAEEEGFSLKKALKIRDQATIGESAEVLRGNASKKIKFRYDKAENCWVRDDDGIDSWSVEDFPTIQLQNGNEYEPWPVVYLTLIDKGLTSVTGEEALKMMEAGATLVDVDMEGQFEKRQMKDSVNVPLAVSIQGNSGFDLLRKVAFGAMGMVAREQNPDFDKQALERVPKDKPVILVCEKGGTLSDTVPGGKAFKMVDGKNTVVELPPVQTKKKAFGIESRSLRAAFKFQKLGYKDVYYLEGGKNRWCAQQLPMQPWGTAAVAQASVTSFATAALIAMFVACGFIFLVLRFRRFRGLATGQESLLAAHVDKGTHRCV